jgi:citrate lyase subunit beta/citryl-CoA lyase
MIAIHPSHVPVINEVFGPSAAETEFYRGLAAAYEEAARASSGAVRYRGLHIDKAHYDKAVQWLAEARAADSRVTSPGEERTS